MPVTGVKIDVGDSGAKTAKSEPVLLVVQNKGQLGACRAHLIHQDRCVCMGAGLLWVVLVWSHIFSTPSGETGNVDLNTNLLYAKALAGFSL